MGLIAKAYVYKGPVIRGIMFQRIPELNSMDYLFITLSCWFVQWTL
ncbi:hypothetical protein ALT1644_520008 [Alteromonas macleodii]